MPFSAVFTPLFNTAINAQVAASHGTASRQRQGPLVVAHAVTNIGTDRSQLATMAQAAKAALYSDNLDVVADRVTLKVKKSWHANGPASRSHCPSRKPRVLSRRAVLGNLILFIWPKTMYIAGPAGEKLAHHFTADEWPEYADLLYQSVPHMPAQGSMHNVQRAPIKR